MDDLVGRFEERIILENKLLSGNPELIAVYGRRRIGKTYLIRTFLKEHIAFEISALVRVSRTKGRNILNQRIRISE